MKNNQIFFSFPVPSSPVHCSVHQNGSKGLVATWSKPAHPRGHLTRYMVSKCLIKKYCFIFNSPNYVL